MLRYRSVLYFNSFMVRLKDKPGMIEGGVVPAFQFLYGAIKSYCIEGSGNMSFKFQFLYGAIKSAETDKNPLGTLAFQFLYGAIKEVHINPLISICWHLNSIHTTV